MSPQRSRLDHWLRRIGLGFRIWRRDRELWKLKEKVDHSRLLAELYFDRWNRDDRFNRGNPLDLMAAKRYEKRAQELEAEVEAYGRSSKLSVPEHSMLGQR